MTLSRDQFQKARDAGFTVEQIAGFEKTRGAGPQTSVAPSKPSIAPKNLITDPLGTIGRSGGKVIGDTFEAVSHPVRTGKALIGLGKGVAQKFTPGVQEEEKMVDALKDFYVDRYGGIEKAKKTVLEDPVGFASDLSIFLTGGGAVAAKVGKVGKLGKLAKIGKTASKIGSVIDPVSATLRGTGAVLKAATKGRKIAPFAKTVDVGVVKAAKEAVVDLPASAKTASKSVPLIESLAAKGLFGKGMVDKINKVGVDLNRYADGVIQKIGASSDLSEAGKKIAEGVRNYKENYFKIKNALYEKATLPSGKTQQIIKVTPTKSRDFVKIILKDKERAAEVLGKSGDIDFFRSLDTALAADAIDGQFIKSAVKELNQKVKSIVDPIATGNKAVLKKLVVSLSDDLDNAIVTQKPELAQAIQEANSFYKSGLQRLNSSYGKKISSLAEAGQYDKIVPAIINKSTSLEDIPKIYQVIGKENIPSLQAAFLENMLEGARKGENFTPTGITRQITKIGDTKLQAILNPQQYQAVKNIEKISQSMGRAEKITGGSQTAFIGRIGGEFAALGMNPLKGMLLLGGDAMLSRFIISPIGQKLLTEGVTLQGGVGKSLIQAGQKVGAKPSFIRGAGQLQEQVQ